MQSWNAAFFLFFLLAIRWGGGISGRVRALNLTVPLGSGRVGSDNLGYGPGSGFSFEPVQTSNTDAVLKKAHRRLFFLRRLRKFGMSPSILKSFYTCTVESILTGCLTAWFGNITAGNRKALQRVVRTARHIVGGELPSLQDIYTRQCTRKARRITKDSSHPSHRLLSLLPSERHLHSIWSHTSRLRDSFFRQAIRLMNSKN